MSTPKVTAWDRHRASLRREIETAALGLFVGQGFEATTIEQIAEAVGISRRSFFRYFGTKEDVLLGDLAARGESIARALASRPRDEDAWTALIAAMRDSRIEFPSDTRTDVAIGRMMLTTPSLRARALEKRLRWQELLVPPVAERVGGADAQLAASAIVAAALSCLDSATEALVASDGAADLEHLYLIALSAVRGAQAETT